ncbi:methyl-accepting chemotaxis protein [Halobellus ruber]|uniref:HAMP domain-containing protein n=1 Tax=Halobellus ruber TaxID=2761102 RepID=A0A7J9SGN5_9EURY|nr:methyl-accepting chemotaxis protein [Halobellus ruber]MBB6645888.1 HAMP domain-containing protein [Halobellus ruber]
MLERVTIDQLDLRPKLIVAFVLVALLVAVTGAVGYTAVSTVDEEAHLIAEDGIRMDASAEMIVAIERQRGAIQAAQLGESGAQEQFNDAEALYTEHAERLEESELSAEQAARFETLQSQHQEYSQLGTEFFEAKNAGNDDLAERKAARMEELRIEMEENAHAIEGSAQEDLEAQVAAADSNTQTAQQEVIGLTLGAFVFAIVIGLFVARRITTPIRQLTEAAVAANNGDLTTEVDDHVEDDEIGRMVTAIKEMQGKLRAVFGDLDTVSRNLETGDLHQDINTEYPGQYGEIMRHLDSGTTQLTTSFGEIQEASNSLRTGDLDQTIASDKPGQYGTVLDDLEEGTETLSDAFAQIATASEGLKTRQLDRRFETDYPGVYGTVLRDLEAGIDQLSDSVGTIQDVADEVAASSDLIAESTEEIEQASEQVAGSVEEISHGADTQSENLSKVAGEMNDVSATIEEIASSAEEVTSTAEAAVERSEVGQEYAAEATEEISSIEAQADDAVGQVKTLDEKMEEIGDIVDLITGIAEQTNILALNASIEAARAGEAGEGFAVVADEIKSLAQEVSDATTEIENQIAMVQSTAGETVDGIEVMRNRVERGSETIEDTIEMFDEIATAVDEAEAGIQEISDATEDQAASSEEVVAMVDEVSSVSDQTAAEASDVSAATEEQTASVSEVSTNVQQLSQIAATLDDNVSEFDTRSGGRTESADAQTGGVSAVTQTDGGNVNPAGDGGQSRQ